MVHLDSLIPDTPSAFAKVTTQSTVLALNPVASVPWSSNIIVSGKLYTTSGVGLGGKTITFTGSGVAGLSSLTTKTDGTFSSTIQSPNTVSTGWKINANFAGDSSYVTSSASQSYNTQTHSTSLSIAISPSSVDKTGTYSVTGTLMDTTTGKPLSAMTISFSASSITISKATTSTTGSYSVSQLKAPSNTGSYYIKAQFGGTTLYSSIDSDVKTLTVTSTTSSQAKK